MRFIDDPLNAFFKKRQSKALDAARSESISLDKQLTPLNFAVSDCEGVGRSTERSDTKLP